MKKIIFFWLLLLAQIGTAQELKLVLPLEQGHSHNDYWRPQPLLNALALGFKSVEADVFLTDGKLLVGHSKNELQPDKTLQALYLNPLADLVKKHRKLYRKPSQLWLYIDIKTESNATYEAVAKALQPYRHLLVHPLKSKEKGWLKVILTGNYPREIVMQDQNRLVYLDGKLDDLPNNMPLTLIPAVSGNWKQSFTWTGEGPMPPAELARLAQLAESAQKQNIKIRFWNMPEANQANLQNIWHQLLKYNCFLIGTDHLDWLHQTLAGHKR